MAKIIKNIRVLLNNFIFTPSKKHFIILFVLYFAVLVLTSHTRYGFGDDVTNAEIIKNYDTGVGFRAWAPGNKKYYSTSNSHAFFILSYFIYKISGNNLAVLRFIPFVFTLLVFPFCILWFKNEFGRKFIIPSLCLFVFHPVLLYHASIFLSENIMIFFVVCFLYMGSSKGRNVINIKTNLMYIALLVFFLLLDREARIPGFFLILNLVYRQKINNRSKTVIIMLFSFVTFIYYRGEIFSLLMNLRGHLLYMEIFYFLKVFPGIIFYKLLSSSRLSFAIFSPLIVIVFYFTWLAYQQKIKSLDFFCTLFPPALLLVLPGVNYYYFFNHVVILYPPLMFMFLKGAEIILMKKKIKKFIVFILIIIFGANSFSLFRLMTVRNSYKYQQPYHDFSSAVNWIVQNVSNGNVMTRKRHILFVKHSDRWRVCGMPVKSVNSQLVEFNDTDELVDEMKKNGCEYLIVDSLKKTSQNLGVSISKHPNEFLKCIWESDNKLTRVYRLIFPVD